ncbi:MAG: hypothetical protein ACXVEE_24370 [Polyangiales bacterium]
MLRACVRLLSVLAFVLVLVVSRRASAYAWMIRHTGSSHCSTCHVDPSGSGLLNDYGRSEISGSLSTKFGNPSPESKRDQFLMGLITPPEWLLLGGSVRTLALHTKVDGATATNDFILMQADLRAAIQAGSFRAYASLGFLSNGNSPASVFASNDASLVSREHWIGYGFLEDKLIVRAGRMPLPFGVRSIEHTQFVRQSTRTDLNDTQQHGVAVAYEGTALRAEIMGIAGNFQTKPDAFRERGYSALVEYTIADRYALGVSSLFTHAKEDLYLRTATNRQAHGAFMRVSPFAPVVVLAELDYVSFSGDFTTKSGLASMVQLDLEPIQGLHLIGTGESLGGSLGQGQGGDSASWGGWGGIAWFPYPHVDIRADYMHRSQVFGTMRIPVDALMFQGHLYL